MSYHAANRTSCQAKARLKGAGAVDTVTIFLTGDMADRLDTFESGASRFIFAKLDPTGPHRLLEGPVWAFVDWVLPELAGLEMVRRLRADPRMAEAHIIMVLEQDEPDDRRRALRAGADDYLIGPLDRTTILDRVLALQSKQSRQSMANWNWGR